jgi:hypothetical protein
MYDHRHHHKQHYHSTAATHNTTSTNNKDNRQPTTNEKENNNNTTKTRQLRAPFATSPRAPLSRLVPLPSHTLAPRGRMQASPCRCGRSGYGGGNARRREWHGGGAAHILIVDFFFPLRKLTSHILVDMRRECQAGSEHQACGL